MADDHPIPEAWAPIVKRIERAFASLKEHVEHCEREGIEVPRGVWDGVDEALDDLTEWMAWVDPMLLIGRTERAELKEPERTFDPPERLPVPVVAVYERSDVWNSTCRTFYEKS